MLFVAVLLQVNCNNYSLIAGVWLFKIKFGELEFSHLLMSVALTILDYQILMPRACKESVFR